MAITSQVTGRQYHPSQCVYLVNPRQAAAYMKHGLELLDVYADDGAKSPQLVFVFDMRDSKPLYEMWREHALD
ncbi:MAG: hypothetical protein LBD92_07280 [Oscillospiraceae bacterium]|jgi:hypothetical protein|nr:hypothetical protein [Oscillospiraceae bacterium]